MNLDQLLRDSAPDGDEMHRETRRMRTRVVAQFQATDTHRPRRRGRWAAGVLAAAAAATAYVVVSPGGPAVSSAYAIDQQSDGDVVVTIHRLEDAAGLEAALREHGIDAVVNFDPLSTEDEFTFEVPGGVFQEPDDKRRLDQAQIPEDIPIPDMPNCGTSTGEPATLTHEGGDWVLLIPGDSPLQDRPIAITTGARGDLGVAYPANNPGAYCVVMSEAG